MGGVIKIIILFSLLVFAVVVLMGLAIIMRSHSFPLANLLGRGRPSRQPEEKVHFLDVLWNTTPSLQKEALRYGMGAGALAFVVGLLFAPQASLVFGVIAFVITPRLISTLEANKKKKDFFKQFPRAVAEMAAVARTRTLLDGFKVVSEEHSPPVSEVFGYIAESAEKGTEIHKAIRDAQDQYQYPGLDKLADAVRIIEELGGGERSAEVLMSAADHIRFLERFRSKIDIAVGGILKEIFLAMSIVVIYFIVTSGPHTEGWENVQKHPGVVLVGFAAIALGWYFSLRKINKFKNKNYL